MRARRRPGRLGARTARRCCSRPGSNACRFAGRGHSSSPHRPAAPLDVRRRPARSRSSGFPPPPRAEHHSAPARPERPLPARPARPPPDRSGSPTHPPRDRAQTPGEPPRTFRGHGMRHPNCSVRSHARGWPPASAARRSAPRTEPSCSGRGKGSPALAPPPDSTPPPVSRAARPSPSRRSRRR